MLLACSLAHSKPYVMMDRYKSPPVFPSNGSGLAKWIVRFSISTKAIGLTDINRKSWWNARIPGLTAFVNELLGMIHDYTRKCKIFVYPMLNFKRQDQIIVVKFKCSSSKMFEQVLNHHLYCAKHTFCFLNIILVKINWRTTTIITVFRGLIPYSHWSAPMYKQAK